MGKILIAETFVSRQGEGRLTGTESFFIRTSGCNLRCWFCDTPYASWEPEGTRHTIQDLCQRVDVAEARIDRPIDHVVLTGGEPLLVPEIEDLLRQLQESGKHVTIETAGTVQRAVKPELLSLSPKLCRSSPDAKQEPRWAALHEQRRLPIATMRDLIEKAKAFQVKFVVDDSDEFDEILSVVEMLGVPPMSVYLMPQGSRVEQLDEARDWLLPWTRSQGFQYCDRMQIRWYGNRRGT